MTKITTPTGIRITDRESQYTKGFKVTNHKSGLSIDVSHNEGASTRYIKSLAKRVTDTINSIPFKESLGEDTYMRFHRDTDAPTAIIVPSLTSRSVTVNLKSPYSNNPMPTKMTAYKGSSIVSKPHNKAVLISMCHEKFDSECDGTITELTLQQEMLSVFDQLDNEITTQIINVLETEDANKAKYYSVINKPSLTGSVADSYETIEQGIYEATHMMRQMGDKLEDFMLSCSPTVYAVLERSARRSGLTSVEDFMGTTVYQHHPVSKVNTVSKANPASDDVLSELFVLPKHLVAASFREDAKGIVIRPIVTRKASTQSTVMELVGVVDIICDGFTKVVSVDDETVTADVKLPLVTKVVFQSDGLTAH